MAEKLLFGEGASTNKPPLFYGLNYEFLKVRMNFFVESIDRVIWDAITNIPFIPKIEKDKVFIDPTCLTIHSNNNPTCIFSTSPKINFYTISKNNNHSYNSNFVTYLLTSFPIKDYLSHL